MSVASPTVLPRAPIFPTLLPKPPQPHPLPLPKYGQQRLRLNAVRDLVREMDELSDEEDELEDFLMAMNRRGCDFIVPIGRMLTIQEEKNDADDDDDDDDGDDDGSEGDDDEDGSDETHESDEDEDEDEEDLDAEMEDMDEDLGNITAETALSDDIEAEDEGLSSEPSWPGT